MRDVSRPFAACLAALCSCAVAGADPDCPGDANGDGQVVFDDITTVLNNWNKQCGAPAIEFLGDQLADPTLVQHVINSPLTQQWGAQLAGMGINLNFNHTSELFYNDFDNICPVVPGDARFVMVPAVDPNGLQIGVYAYTYSDMTGVEGADYMTFFDPAVDPNQQTIRVYTDPNFMAWLDIELINNDCNTEVTSSENPGVPFDASGEGADRGSYLQCLGMGIAPKILLAKGLGLDKACILSCKVCAGAPTPVTCSGCAACAAVAVGIIAHVWWCCP